MLPRLVPATAAALREALTRAGYTTDGVRTLLGPQAHSALGRGEPEPAFRAAAGAGELGVLVRLLLLGATEPDDAVAAALAPLAPADVAAAGLLRRDGDGWAAAVDVRPHGLDDHDWWVVSDLDTRRQDREYVTGVGAASLTLAAATLRSPAGSVLDLGTGCGVQALHASTRAGSVTATDVAPRALAMAAATFALNDVDVELLAGPWFTPVTGRRFDRIVSNPPFVPGPPRLDLVYRDSGRGGDDALADLVRALPAHLAPGGIGQLLGAWLHVRGEDWTERVRSWLPGGVDAWVLQREVTEPALHVGTWQRDAGVDPASPAGRAQAARWLDWMESERVEGIGFGFLTLRRTAGEPAVVFEDLPGAMDDPLGPEVAGWLDRLDWLRAHRTDDALLGARLAVAGTVVLERYATAGEEGWAEAGAAVVRADGPRWRHEVDELAAALLAGCRGALPLRELLELLAFAHDRPVGELAAAALPAVRDLVRHGLLVPAAWADAAAAEAADPPGAGTGVAGAGRARTRGGPA
ncbi:MAG TPA: methyltransferase [Pseudonocardia sp.]|nr:methyltransferase [Pseudonocardia sp.]